ncbi:hypothetical protein FRB94_002317 [Tulasnella sp. JGI-2019a]|nr:hypothetical protein FRB94_002317 [Tulasnella sp. JGI-2019a]
MQSIQRSILRQSLRARPTRLVVQRTQVAALHNSLPAQKKKSKVIQEEDLFDSDIAEDDDLFGGVASSKSGPSVAAGNVAPIIPPSATAGRDTLDPKRAARFEEERQAVLYRCAPDRARPRARQDAVRNVLMWADTAEQLEAAAELVPAMRRAGVTVSEETSRDFIGRCLTLRRPDIALRVLTERNKYGIDLDLKSARDILHSIFVRVAKPSPIDASLDADAQSFAGGHYEDAFLLSALYPYYKLINISQDPISSTILLSMFSRLNTEASSLRTSKEQLESFREFRKSIATDFSTMIKEKKVHVVNERDDSRRQRVWLQSEVRRPAVRTLLASFGIGDKELMSIGAIEPRAG